MTPIDKERLMDELIEQIRSRHLQPEDRYEIAAMLESFGWNDERATLAFGVDDVFELASVIMDKMQQNVMFTPFTPIEKRTLKQIAYEISREFFRGMIFALPMAISVISMLFLKLSLWSYEYLPLDLATAIGVGTVISFVVVGGFTQAIARRGFFYIMLGYYNMARRMTFYFIRKGFLASIAVCALLYLVNAVLNLFPQYLTIIILLYFVFLNSIWISVTSYYILRKELVFTFLITFGIILVWLLFDVFQVANIVVSQLIALSVVSVISVLLVVRYFREAERKMEKGIAPVMPRMSITLYSTLPYFFYGFVYFAFLFADRFVSWSTPEEYVPYVLWFRGPYEIGLDFALFVLMVPMGISEVIVNKMMNDIQASQKGYLGTATEQMNKLFKTIYVKQSAIMWVVSICNAVALYWLAKWFFTAHPQFIGIMLFRNETTHFVFVWALAGYAMVASALMNAVILFSLAQPKMVVRSIVPALALNVAIGFVMTRWTRVLIEQYHWSAAANSYAVFGLVAGAALFAVLSTRSVMKMINKLDYYVYAAA